MSKRCVALSALLATACPADTDTAGATESGSTSGATDVSTSNNVTATPPGMTTAPSSSSASNTTTGPTTATTEPTTEATTDPPATTDGGSETGEPPTGSPGCRAEENLAEGEHMFMLDGYDRTYALRLPENYSNDQPWPLIFALHGNGGDIGYWDGEGGDRDIRAAFATEAIIVIPEAINNAWRDYNADPSTWPMFMDLELNFFDEVYETAQNELCIDTTNVFSMGFSGGGSFSGVLGCRRDYIRAIAVGGSVIYFEEADCVETPAAWITIGEQEFSDGRAAFRDFFRDLAGCDAASTPGDPAGCEDYDNCGAGTPVTYCSHPAGHVWPSIGTDATKTFFQSFYLAE